MFVTPKTAVLSALVSTVERSCKTAQKEMEVLYLPTGEEAVLFQVFGVRETEVVRFRGRTTRDNVAHRFNRVLLG